MEPLYPDVEVRLSGEDGNAFAVIGRVTSALKSSGIPEKQCRQFVREATWGDYDHVIQTAIKWVSVS